MKRVRILWALLAAALLLTALALPALAEIHPYDMVLDYAGLLTDEEYDKLNDKAWTLSDKYDMDIAILTAQSTEGKGQEAYTDDYWDENGYGRGANHDGLMLALYMQERQMHISTEGEGIRDFTDYGINRVFDEIGSYMSDGDYYRGFDLYLDLADNFIHEARENRPYDTNNEYNGVPLSAAQKIGGGAGIGALIGLLSSLIGVGRMKSSMHTVRPKFDASQYYKKGSLQLNRVMDVFLYHTVHRERIEHSSSGGGGSSTHISSGGHTHGGGSRGF